MRPITDRLWIFALLLIGCGGAGDTTYKINFEALVAGAPFRCQTTYDNIGTSKSSIQPIDFRYYVHDVALIRTGGARVPLALTVDPVWQSARLALLDFEDGTGMCNTASPQTRTFVTGSAPGHSDYTGIEFGLGVPPDIDHLDVDGAPPPQNVPAMWWTWRSGYVFSKIDVHSTKNDSWNFHIGAIGCTGASATGINCQFDNQAVISLSNFNPASSKVAMDLATLYADSDLDRQVDGMSDFVAGCMSGQDDPECPALYSKLGMKFQSNDAGPTQTFFAVSE